MKLLAHYSLRSYTFEDVVVATRCCFDPACLIDKVASRYQTGYLCDYYHHSAIRKPSRFLQSFVVVRGFSASLIAYVVVSLLASPVVLAIENHQSLRGSSEDCLPELDMLAQYHCSE